jgi:hypothetical protein
MARHIIPFLFFVSTQVGFGQTPTPAAPTAPPPAVASTAPADANSTTVTAVAASAPTPASTGPTDLPLKIPGFELRVLDLTKKVTFVVGQQTLQVDLPIYVYYPTESDALKQSSSDMAPLVTELQQALKRKDLPDDLRKQLMEVQLRLTEIITEMHTAVAPTGTEPTPVSPTPQ